MISITSNGLHSLAVTTRNTARTVCSCTIVAMVVVAAIVADC